MLYLSKFYIRKFIINKIVISKKMYFEHKIYKVLFYTIFQSSNRENKRRAVVDTFFGIKEGENEKC